MSEHEQDPNPMAAMTPLMSHCDDLLVVEPCGCLVDDGLVYFHCPAHAISVGAASPPPPVLCLSCEEVLPATGSAQPDGSHRTLCPACDTRIRKELVA